MRSNPHPIQLILLFRAHNRPIKPFFIHKHVGLAVLEGREEGDQLFDVVDGWLHYFLELGHVGDVGGLVLSQILVNKILKSLLDLCLRICEHEVEGVRRRLELIEIIQRVQMEQQRLRILLSHKITPIRNSLNISEFIPNSRNESSRQEARWGHKDGNK